MGTPCATRGCQFFGSETSPHCSSCDANIAAGDLMANKMLGYNVGVVVDSCLLVYL